MRVKLLVGVVMQLGAAVALGQSAPSQGAPPSPNEKSKDAKQTKKSDVVVALYVALKNTPDLRVAFAKVAEAEAQLIRARAQVVQKVVAAYQAIDAAKAKLEESDRRLRRLADLRAKVKGAVSDDDYHAAVATVAQAKAALAAAESELDYLTGKGKHAEKTSTTRYRVTEAIDDAIKQRWSSQTYPLPPRSGNEPLSFTTPYGPPALPKSQAKGPAADRIRKALEKKGKFEFKDTTARKVLEAIQAEAKRSGIHVQANAKGSAWDEGVTATLDDAPLATALQLLEDALDGHRVVVRDYGLLIVPQGKMPPDAVTLSAFLQQKQDPTVARGKEPVNGKVTKVEGNQVVLSIGADAGLAKGDVLELYRLAGQGKGVYLGKVKVVEVTAKSAVAEAVGKLSEAAKVGDEVTTQLPLAK